ncbi:MAG: Histidine kinase, gyrase and HSP90-like ATPase [Anaerocolumna sp.]|nr:Histidine kinase, gyrase and HSP90-like ATPase [Anaerocolumna sp.]
MEIFILTYIITLLTYLLAFFTFIQYCNYNVLPKKSQMIFIRNYYVVILLIAAFSFANIVNTRVVFILLLFIFMILTYTNSIRQTLIHSIIFSALYILPYICIYLFITELTSFITHSKNTLYIICNQNITHIIISTVLYVVYTLILSTRILHKNHIHNPYKKFITILLLMISLLLGSFVIYSFNPTTKKDMEATIIVIFIVSIIITILILSFYDKIISSLQQITLDQLIFQKYEIAQSYYDELLVKSKQLSALRHDFKNHLGVIQSRLEKENYGEAIDYLISLTVHTNTAGDFVMTNSTIISSILQSKKSECELKRIQFEYETLFDKIYNVSDLELIIILGNILDNAIEATEKVLPKDKAILLTINQINTYLVIQCTNPYVEKPTLKNGRLVTTKDNKALHGIGLTNVIEVCEKYGGECTFTFENDLFVINILLPNY